MMMFKLFATATTLCLMPTVSVVGFVPPKTQTKANVVAVRSAVGSDQDPSSSSPLSTSSNNKSFDEMAEELLSKIPEIDFQSIDLDTIKSNILEGDVGNRGEAYAAAQFALLLFIVSGGIPLVGDLLMALLGPTLLVAGIATIGLSIKDLGNNLSPWIVPSPEGDLIRDGIYGKLRHPQYAGLLATLGGFAIVSGSANRLLLTAVLFYVFNEMANMEEDELIKKYPNDYDRYKKQVPGMFFPDEIVQQFPWNNNINQE